MEPVDGAADRSAATWGEETIVAVSTATGPGAIGIVRLSGPDAVAIAQSAFVPARGVGPRPEETYSMLYGHVVDPYTGESIDEALLALMRAPRSYTREDIVELHCHGGLAAQRAVLRLMIRLGARLAEPGEFTRRAFLNGRIDLAQAESVAAIVSARSSGALRASVRQLEGGLSERLRSLRKVLVGILAQAEVTVDFSDEDVDPLDWGALVEGLGSVEEDLARLHRTAFLGRALEHGVRTAIVGKPNVGKSSLLNALLMRERAIVSDVPGTTRDTVEDFIEIGGIPIQLVDTAGMRSGGDHVERLGVERSLRAMEQADLVLAVFDLSVAWDDTDQQLVDRLDPERSIIVGNKSDLVPWTRSREMTGIGHGHKQCVVSALTGEGIDDVRGLIQEIITGGEGLAVEEPVLATERHRNLVGKAVASTRAARACASLGRDEELVCEDIREAVHALGRITGEDLTPDLLDEIFSKFCLGK
ncbi:MAG: tRNA uridine-5-carboxymethylaminomethyl(34) synthesis GTPase MnmE [Acidobacteria bacterium RBG_16_64_8]|nr:MAG: tRNA uridine-5-carboxymethylaminomethyl(34) synthesis GTPase MnmE [Acidobacteria bacterium RBG_16_64_8]